MSHRRLLGAAVLGVALVCAATTAISQQNWPQVFFEEEEKKRAEAARAAEKARRERAAEQARAAAERAEQQRKAQAAPERKPKERPAEARTGGSTEPKAATDSRRGKDAQETKGETKGKQVKETGGLQGSSPPKQASEPDAAAAKAAATPPAPSSTPAPASQPPAAPAAAPPPPEKQAGAVNPATAAAGPAAGAAAKSAGDQVEKELERYRAMLSDPFANPGLLFVDRGEQHWTKPAGPKNASLETCDLGKGPGTLEGAYAELPRYFADAGRVLDLEGRLLWCMETIQGRDPKDIVKAKFSTAEKTSELEDLTAFVANKSNGQKLAIKLEHPKEKEAYAVGEALFNRRQGPWDFACATCHEYEGKRIRLQNLPTFNDPKQAGAVMGTWPAYRVSQNTVRTMQHRLYDCFWQMRLPAVDYASDVTVALTTYLAKKGEGGVIEAPSIKR